MADAKGDNFPGMFIEKPCLPNIPPFVHLTNEEIEYVQCFFDLGFKFVWYKEGNFKIPEMDVSFLPKDKWGAAETAIQPIREYVMAPAIITGPITEEERKKFKVEVLGMGSRIEKFYQKNRLRTNKINDLVYSISFLSHLLPEGDTRTETLENLLREIQDLSVPVLNSDDPRGDEIESGINSMKGLLREGVDVKELKTRLRLADPKGLTIDKADKATALALKVIKMFEKKQE